MVKKLVFLLFFFYFLTLLQVSFLVHFDIRGIVPNFVLFAVIFFNLFSYSRIVGFGSALLGGFFLDVFSLSFIGFFGFYTPVSLLISLFIKLVLQRHVYLPLVKRPY